jgi:hypothetical protein
MQNDIRLLSIVGFFGCVAAANAQTQSPPAVNTQFDGTYAFVSATKVNETWRDYHNREYPCGDYPKGGLLTIVNGYARYTVWGRGYYEGTVSSRGELTIRFANTVTQGGWAGVGQERMIFGKIGGGGTARVRRIAAACNYDLVLQKQSN